MTQEDKELLMRDLSCRIPYGVIVNVYRMPNVKLTSVSWYDEVSVEDSVGLYPISEVKPYMFPLSSMTEEQQISLTKFVTNGIKGENILYDWYNKNHFDYRGLIEKGLAIDATGLNIYWIITTNNIEKPRYSYVARTKKKLLNITDNKILLMFIT